MAGIFGVETNAGGVPTKYTCEQLMENNEAYLIEADYYYDVMHDIGLDTAEVVAKGKAALLDNVAKHFGLIDGARCSIPPVHSLWLINVASGDSDVHEDQFSKPDFLVFLFSSLDVCSLIQPIVCFLSV